MKPINKQLYAQQNNVVVEASAPQVIPTLLLSDTWVSFNVPHALATLALKVKIAKNLS